MKQKENRILYLTAFSLSALLIICVMALNDIVPFGRENTLLWIDANGQYISYFGYYKDMLAGQRSPLFSFAKLIGGDMAGMMAYYLLSPFNLVFALFPKEMLPQAFSVVGVLKIGAAGLTAAVFFNHKGLDKRKVLLLATAYALMSYNIIYLPNIMWIDGVIALPLVALGIDLIFEGKSALTYILRLAYGIFVNYYIGFMLCGASVLYFVYKLIKGEVKRFWHIVSYGVASLAGGLLNMALILPVLKSLEGTSKKSMPLSQFLGLETQLSFRELISHIVFPKTTMNDMTIMLPNVFTGFVILLLCAIFLVWFKVSLRTKFAAVVVAVALLASCYFKTLYYIWHGLANPICFEYRFAFVISFFMILIAAEFLGNIKLSKYVVYGLMAINCISLLWYGNRNYKVAGFPENHFKSFISENLPIVNEIKSKEEDVFYRIEKDYKYSENDAMALDYNGLSHYSSGEKLITRRAIEEAGYAFNEGYGYYGNGSTISSDSMFSIKYLMYKDTDRGGLVPEKEYENISVYKNPYAFPLVIKAKEKVTEIELKYAYRGALANDLINAAWDKEFYLANFIDDIKLTTENINAYKDANNAQCYAVKSGGIGKLNYTFTAPQDTNLYVLLIGQNQGRINNIICGDKVVAGYPNHYDHGVRYLRQVKEGEKVTVTFEINGDINAQRLFFMYDDFDYLNQMKELMAENSYKEENFDGDSFTVSGVMDQSEGVLMMLPYHDGWNIKVNGVKTQQQPVLENFVYVPVPQGQFTIDVSFTPPGLVKGAAVSLIGLLLTAALLLIEKKYKTK